MCSPAEASTAREEIEKQIAKETLAVFKQIRVTGISDEAAARMTNGVMVATDYVLQYKAEWFLIKHDDTPCPEFTTADKIAPIEPDLNLPKTNPKAIEDLVKKQAASAAAPEVPKVDPPKPASALDVPRPQPTGPVVPAAKRSANSQAPSNLDAPLEESSTVCVKCGTKCWIRQGTFGGVPYVFCPTCKKARKLNGQAFVEPKRGS